MSESGWVDYMAEAEDALARLELADPYTTPDRLVAIAQVNATRALVEQQRIANLIALGQLQILSGMDGRGVLVGDGAPFRRLYPDGECTPLAQDIAAALGIGDDHE